jgi:hypothetical protein
MHAGTFRRVAPSFSDRQSAAGYDDIVARSSAVADAQDAAQATDLVGEVGTAPEVEGRRAPRAASVSSRSRCASIRGAAHTARQFISILQRAVFVHCVLLMDKADQVHDRSLWAAKCSGTQPHASDADIGESDDEGNLDEENR